MIKLKDHQHFQRLNKHNLVPQQWLQPGSFYLRLANVVDMSFELLTVVIGNNFIERLQSSRKLLETGNVSTNWRFALQLSCALVKYMAGFDKIGKHYNKLIVKLSFPGIRVV